MNIQEFSKKTEVNNQINYSVVFAKNNFKTVFLKHKKIL